jgi:peptidoglycan/LPS O-acetylase OafA/YrhL
LTSTELPPTLRAPSPGDHDRHHDRHHDTGRAPDPGFYPVPTHGHDHDHDHHADRHGVVERRWDGDVWNDWTRPAPEGTTLERHRRRPLAFLRTPGWALLAVYLVATVSCMVLVARDPHATRPSGIVWLLPVLGFVSAATVMVAVVLYFQRRLRFDQVGERAAIAAWGVASGVVGIGVALLGEVVLPRAFGSNPDHQHAWTWIAGPAEETGKLLLPVVLWFVGRYRLPRQGFLLVVCSAATFGVLEAARYGLSPDLFTWSRGGGEILHVALTGFVAAVAWQAAWRRPLWFTAAGVGAVAVAMLLHSVNDVLVLDPHAPKAAGSITLVVMIVLYVATRHSARQMVPPDNVAAVSSRWRPVAPRSAAPAGDGTGVRA